MAESPKHLIFVCTGNYYRSRLAEILFRHYSGEESGRWTARSRGLSVTGALHGMAPEAVSFLEAMGVSDTESSRDPCPLLVDELIAAGHVVLMNRMEHEPMIGKDFRAVYLRLLEKKAVTFWNVFDLPRKKPVWGKQEILCQPAASATEHIHFAVRDLVTRIHSFV